MDARSLTRLVLTSILLTVAGCGGYDPTGDAALSAPALTTERDGTLRAAMDPLDTDADGVADDSDPCPLDAANDPDGDGLCGVSTPQPVVAALEAVRAELARVYVSQLDNPNQAKALLNKLAAVAREVDEGNLDDAAEKLEHDLLAKTDGCSRSWRPDANDWFVCCGAQFPVEAAIRDALAALGR